MKLDSSILDKFVTTNDQLLIQVERKSEETNTGLVSLSNSSDKEITSGIIMSSTDEHPTYVGQEAIFPTEGSIVLDSWIDFSDSDQYEYRMVKIKNVFLIKQPSDNKKQSIKE